MSEFRSEPVFGWVAGYWRDKPDPPPEFQTPVPALVFVTEDEAMEALGLRVELAKVRNNRSATLARLNNERAEHEGALRRMRRAHGNGAIEGEALTRLGWARLMLAAETTRDPAALIEMLGGTAGSRGPTPTFRPWSERRRIDEYLDGSRARS